ncbi:MAG: cytochrome P450 [Pseudomonadales bacterium]
MTPSESELLRTRSLQDADVQEDPTPYHHALHQQPIHFDARLGFYICSTYELMRRILRDPESFSNVDSQRVDGLRQPPPEVLALRRSGYPPVNTLVTNDPPSHTRIRRMVDEPFRPRRIDALKSSIRDIVDETVDAVAARGACEAVADLAVPIPVRVIADMLGLHRNLAPQIKVWSDASVAPLGLMVSDARLIECAQLMREFQDVMAAELESRRQNPRDDLLSGLVSARDEHGQGLSMAEMLSLTQQFLVAGNETTTNAIAAGIQLLAAHPDQYRRLQQRADDRVLKTFANEVLRLESPVQGLFRVVTRDTRLADVTLPAGARIMLRFAAANRDPEQYPEPDRLDVERGNSATHLAFGAGIHHCIGASLAREELVATFDVLLERTRNLRLAPHREPPRHHPSIALRGLERLDVEFDPA